MSTKPILALNPISVLAEFAADLSTVLIYMEQSPLNTKRLSCSSIRIILPHIGESGRKAANSVDTDIGLKAEIGTFTNHC